VGSRGWSRPIRWSGPLGGKKPLPGTAEAEDRFVRGAHFPTQLPDNPSSYQEAVAGVLQMFDLALDLEAAGDVSAKFRAAKALEFQKAGTAVTWKPAPKSA
jgi:surface antigen